MRKLFSVLAVILALSMVLSACATPTAAPQPQAEPAKPTEAAAPAATEAPKPDDAAAPAATEAPTAEPAAEPTPTELPAQNPYVGSGALDGNGIPADFFMDIHIRKAFSYAFDHETFINDVYRGEAIVSPMLMLPGMPGYDEEFPHYTLDLAKAEEEFKLADVDKDGIPAGEDPDDVWEMGFRMTMLFNTGNTTRQVLAQILQENLAAINPKFQIEVNELPWPSYLSNQRAHRIPIMTAGWQEDIPDASNWFQPYTIGTYGARQAMPAELMNQFPELLKQAVENPDQDARGEIYQKIQQIYYDEAIGLPLVVSTQHAFEQKWLQGRVMNSLLPIIFKDISKAEGAKNMDTLTIADTGDVISMDPLSCYDTASAQAVGNIYDQLITYDGVKLNEFVPMLAESWEKSEDGKTWTFQLRKGVTFHEGQELMASDVKYSLMRTMLNGGGSTPALLLTEPFLGTGIIDVTQIIDPELNLMDNREELLKVDPEKLAEPCNMLDKAITADNETGVVTFQLPQPWGPFEATLTGTWGSIYSQEWVAANGGWDGKCEDWANYYAIPDADSPFTKIANGTGAYKLVKWDQGVQYTLTAAENYWGEKPAITNIVDKIIPEFGTRLSMMQAGDADIMAVPVEMRPQLDQMVGAIRVYDPETGEYKEDQAVCKVDGEKLGMDQYEICESDPDNKPLRLYYGAPLTSMDVIIYNFGIQ